VSRTRGALLRYPPAQRIRGTLTQPGSVQYLDGCALLIESGAQLFGCFDSSHNLVPAVCRDGAVSQC
jgi:hypothetical protein